MLKLFWDLCDSLSEKWFTFRAVVCNIFLGLNHKDQREKKTVGHTKPAPAVPPTHKNIYLGYSTKILTFLKSSRLDTICRSPGV